MVGQVLLSVICTLLSTAAGVPAGTVASAKLRKPIDPTYDALLVNATKHRALTALTDYRRRPGHSLDWSRGDFEGHRQPVVIRTWSVARLHNERCDEKQRYKVARNTRVTTPFPPSLLPKPPRRRVIIGAAVPGGCKGWGAPIQQIPVHRRADLPPMREPWTLPANPNFSVGSRHRGPQRDARRGETNQGRGESRWVLPPWPPGPSAGNPQLRRLLHRCPGESAQPSRATGQVRMTTSGEQGDYAFPAP